MDAAEKGQVTRSAADVYQEFFVPSLFQQWAGPVVEAAGIKPGHAVLDVACGTGQNAIWLSQRGWQVDGVDVSETGLRLAARTAVANDAAANWIEADLDDWVPEANVYDLVVVFRFLDRVCVPRVVHTGLRQHDPPRRAARCVASAGTL